ncbi:MAG: hypothetical protein Q8L74_04625 [Nitrospirota bacterium]|nr:hypothetical protein [Nitrospirota bacterium]MDP2381219.1 hypothetical protein [Nitrospirota bacterium]
MALSSPSSRLSCLPKTLLLLALACLSSTACSATSQTGRVLSEDPRGTVSLQALSDRSIQASHPIHLEPALIAKILSGMQVQEQQRGLQDLLAGSASPVPVFSPEEVQFLTPRIAKALTTAGTGEAVSFQVTSPRQGMGRLEHSVTETTAGSLYAYGLSLYVTISQYRYAPGQPHINDPAHRRLPDPSGLSNRALLFTPSAAQRSDSFSRPTGGSSSDRFLAIDYQLLQHTSPPMAAIEQTVPLVQQEAMSNRESLAGAKRSESQSDALAQREAEIHTLKDLVIKKDLELEVLRKELLSVRKQLDSQKRNPARSSKPQHIAP